METNTLKTKARELVLVDIENLAGTPSPSQDQIADIKAIISRYTSVDCLSQCVVACSHHAASEVLFAFPSALRRVKSGVNGADIALVEELSDHRVIERFEKIVVCSGDWIFTDEVARLGQNGVDVTVIARKGSLSKQLQLAARNVITFTYDEHGTPSAALQEAC